MKETPLAACPGCARHVRVSESTCPFCRAELPPSFRKQAAPPTPATRLSRAALYALRVGTLSVTTVACGGSLGAGGSEKDSGSTDATSLGEAAYGGPPPASEDGGQDGAPFVGTMYGGFFPVGMDASTDSLVDAARDGGSSDGGQADASLSLCSGSIGAAYGGFPFGCNWGFPDAGPTDGGGVPE